MTDWREKITEFINNHDVAINTWNDDVMPEFRSDFQSLIKQAQAEAWTRCVYAINQVAITIKPEDNPYLQATPSKPLEQLARERSDK